MRGSLSANISKMVGATGEKCSDLKVSLTLPYEPPKYLVYITPTGPGEAPKL